jgi:hypothetical protein
VDQLLTLYAVTHPLSLHYNWLLLGSFLEKICGGIAAAGIIIRAYATDRLPEKRKEGFRYVIKIQLYYNFRIND